MFSSSSKAAILIIGDEILSGRVQDTNTSFIAKLLNSKGIVVAEARIVPDQEKEIIEAVTLLSSKYDYLFTTGGIGPTHDDITAEAVAAACNKQYILHQKAYKQMTEFVHKDGRRIDMSGANKKMAYMPEGADLLDNAVSGAPGFTVDNIYVLPGVPFILESMLPQVISKFTSVDQIITKELKLFVAEGNIAEELAKIQQRYANISIGSYPQKRENNRSVTILVLSGNDQNKILAGYKELENNFNQYRK